MLRVSRPLSSGCVCEGFSLPRSNRLGTMPGFSSCLNLTAATGRGGLPAGGAADLGRVQGPERPASGPVPGGAGTLTPLPRLSDRVSPTRRRNVVCHDAIVCLVVPDGAWVCMQVYRARGQLPSGCPGQPGYGPTSQLGHHPACGRRAPDGRRRCSAVGSVAFRTRWGLCVRCHK